MKSAQVRVDTGEVRNPELEMKSEQNNPMMERIKSQIEDLIWAINSNNARGCHDEALKISETILNLTKVMFELSKFS